MRRTRSFRSVGIALLLAVAIAACVLAWTTLAASGRQVEIMGTRDADRHRAVEQVPDARGIAHVSVRSARRHTVSVDADDTAEATRLLERSGLGSRTRGRS